MLSGDFSGCDNFAPPADLGIEEEEVRNLVNAQDWGVFARIMGSGFSVSGVFFGEWESSWILVKGSLNC